ncbi:hypothetical protein [Actinomycetospora soli]|uniref:hypothetical protein n=1 Tax=Actinomycetospora soli TaxID=2893887 RepID=UPI001E5AFC06|nr:hypothetical protein [Actinomycetospora soli]MCD2185634.1 hypothetical protein [Actinomycetospora soli]
MSGEATGPGEVGESDALRAVASQVVVEVETWAADGLGRDVALALVQNALPLLEGTVETLPRLQRRAHAQVLTALLLLLDDPVAGALATDLVEVLRDVAPRPRVLAG